MNYHWFNQLVEAVRSYIEADNNLRKNKNFYAACHPPKDSTKPEDQSYWYWSQKYNDAYSNMWSLTDCEYDDKDAIRAACWQWRYCKVMARKCCYLQLKYPNEGSRMAAELMQKLHMAEMNLMSLLGLLAEYIPPVDKSARCATLVA